MKHFKFEIIINDYIENFNKDKMKINFVELQLFNQDEDKLIIIKNRRYNILYKSLSYPISFNLFVLNNSSIKEEKIDYLMDEGYEVKEIILYMEYNDEEIEDYEFNKFEGEQIDLINFIKNKNEFEITNNSSICLNNIIDDLEILFLPINDNNYPVKRKLVCKNSEFLYGIEYSNNGMFANIGKKGLLDTFGKIEVLISSKNTVIAPKDLDYFAINIGNQFNINFGNNEKVKNQFSLDDYGNLNIKYITPYFKLCDIRTILLGHIYKIENKIYFEFNIKYSKESKSDILNKIKEFY